MFAWWLVWRSTALWNTSQALLQSGWSKSFGEHGWSWETSRVPWQIQLYLEVYEIGNLGAAFSFTDLKYPSHRRYKTTDMCFKSFSAFFFLSASLNSWCCFKVRTRELSVDGDFHVLDFFSDTSLYFREVSLDSRPGLWCLPCPLISDPSIAQSQLFFSCNYASHSSIVRNNVSKKSMQGERATRTPLRGRGNSYRRGGARAVPMLEDAPWNNGGGWIRDPSQWF